jgi:predicted permease
MRGVLQDLRYSLRQLIKNPGFTLTAVISLALGIGAATAVFSVIYAALMNPFPYPTADRIVRLTINSEEEARDWASLNGPQIQQLRQLGAVENVLAMDYHATTLTGHDLPENVETVGLISTGFQDLGVPPFLGRGILPSDAPDGQDPEPVAVLSYKFWRKQFFGSPDVLGKTLQLDHKNYTIVGVAAPRFTWYSADVYFPVKLTQDPARTFVVNVLLKPGITHAIANAQLQPVMEQFAKDMPRHFPEHFTVHVEGLNEWALRRFGTTLYLMFGAVMLLLAIGCGNVSILLLARGTARQHELAVRSAIGAARSRILRQLLTESLLLAGVGAVLGILTSYGILAGIKLILPPYAFAPEVVIGINLRVLVFGVGVAIGTGVLFGLWPALQLSRTQVGQIMQSSARRVAGSVQGRRAHNVLIAGQIALTLLLLAGAGSALKNFSRVLHTPLGYDPHNVMSVGFPLHDNSYTTWSARATYFEQLRSKLGEMPGVIVTAISSNATPPRSGGNTLFEILGRPPGGPQLTSVDLISPEYFAVLHIPPLQGRIWNDTENHNGAHVAVVNRTLAQRYFPNGDAIGHSVRLTGLENRPPELLTAPNIADSWLQIVGIVEDSRNDGLLDPIKPAVAVPYTLSMSRGTQILVKTEVPPLTLVHAARLQLAAVNPDQQAWDEVEDLDSWISNGPEWQQEHLSAWLFGIFAWLALALAAVGLYSVVSYTVAQRTNEFGIRMALGAGGGDLLRIVFISAAGSVSGGIVAGVVLTFALSKVFAKWAEGNSRDPVILVAGILVLGLVATIACAIPARRASTVDPMTALRCD